LKILLVTSSLPYPPVVGAKLRVWNLLKHIADLHEVTLLSLLDSADEAQYIPYLQRYCSRVETIVKQRRRPRGKLLLRLLQTMLVGQPPRNGIAYFKEMKLKIQEVIKSQVFDIVHIEQSHMAPYVEFMDCAKNPAYLITLYDIGATQYERLLAIKSTFQNRFFTWLDWFFLRSWEPSYLAHHFDKCMVVSSVDRDILRKANPALDPVVISNGVDTSLYELLPDCSESKDILFIGKMNYPPNVDSVLFFYQEVFPLVRRQVSEARILIVGTSPSPEIQDLANDPKVELAGQVEDIIPYYKRACISAVALRAAGGTRLKILESMALGRPVISTSIGCEGLAVTHGENILIADTPADFAARTVQLMKDKDLRQRLILNGRRLVEKEYDWKIIAQQLIKVYDEVVSLKGDSTI